MTMRDAPGRTAATRLDDRQLLDMIRCDWRREVLDNGLVVLLHRDPSTPLVHIGISYRVGSMDEGPGQTGLAHMFEHLMFGGTKLLPGSYVTRMKAAGALDVNAMTGRDMTRYFQTVPPHLLEFALFAEADRMGNFVESIDGPALERERKVIVEEKKQTEAQPMGKLFLWLAEGLFATGHPCRHPTIGHAYDIAGYTLDDVRAWHATHYAPGNAAIVVSGGIDPDATLALVERYFGHIAPGPRPQRVTARVDAAVRDSAMRVSQRIGIPGSFYQAWVTPSMVASPRESVALTLAVSLLAGGQSSVLHRRLVAESDLATQVSGFHMPGRAAGAFVIDASLKARADGRVGTAIVDAVRAFATTPVAAERMALLRSKRLVSTVQSLVSFERKAAMLLEGEIIHEAPGWFRAEAELIATIDEAEIRAAAGRWLGSNGFALSIDPMPDHVAAVRAPAPMPPPGDPAAAVIRAPEWEEATLANGVRVRVSRRTGDPVLHVRLAIGGGQAVEPPGREGLAAMVGAIPEIGVGDEDGPALADRIARAHLSFSMGVSLASVQMDVGGLRGGLPDAAALLADAVLRPRYRSAAFDRYMASTIANADGASRTPQRRAMLASFRALLGERHRLAAPAAVAPDLTVAEVEAFHHRLLRPQDAVIFVAGDVDMAATVATLEAALAGWPAADGPAPARRLELEPARPGLMPFEAAGTGSVQISLVWRTRYLDEDEHVALSCLGHILGGAYGSRANTRLREELAWTYGVQGGTGVLVPVVGPDYGMLRAAVNEAHVGAALVELETLIEGLRGDAPARAEEIEAFRRAERDRMARLNETPMHAVQTMHEMFDEDKAPGDWIAHRDRVERLDPAVLAGLAGDLLPPRGSVVCTLTGDLARIRASLAAAGLTDRIVAEERR